MRQIVERNVLISHLLEKSMFKSSRTMRTATFIKLQFWLLLAAAGAQAQGLLIDQSLQPPLFTGSSIHYDSLLWSLVPGTGQEFTPSLQGLDFVDINLSNPVATNTGTFEIAIHEGSITAPVLGLSEPVIRSQGYPQSDTHFTFPSTVSLVPGDIYVLEILQLAGNSGWNIEIPASAVVNGQTIDMNYPGGRLIYSGVPQDSQDMIFQEGIIVPEPGVPALCLFGGLAFSFIRRGSLAR